MWEPISKILGRKSDPSPAKKPHQTPGHSDHDDHVSKTGASSTGLGPASDPDRQEYEATRQYMWQARTSLEKELGKKTSEVLQLKQRLDANVKSINKLKAVLRRLKRHLKSVEGKRARTQRSALATRDLTLSRQTVLLDECFEEIQSYLLPLSWGHNTPKQENELPSEPNCSSSVRVQQKTSHSTTKDEALEAEIAKERDGNKKLQKIVDELQRDKSALRARNKVLASAWVTQLQKDDETNAVILQQSKQLFIQQQTHEKEMKEAERLWNNSTPRSILVTRLLSQKFEAASPGPEAAEFLESCSMAALTGGLLDISLNPQQARRFAEDASTDSLIVNTCDLCQLPKLALKTKSESRDSIDEFAPSRPTNCCSSFICMTCGVDSIRDSIENGWWKKLESENWVTCPMPSCQSLFSIFEREGEEEEESNDEGCLELTDRLQCLRSALRRIEPRPSDEALQMSAFIHNALAAAHQMHSLFDTSFKKRGPDADGSITTFDPYHVEMIKVDYAQGSIEVPLFTDFIRRTKERKECRFCANHFYDIDYKSIPKWRELCKDFRGDWMWKILSFPVKMSEKCIHSINFCTGCLQGYLKFQLEANGRSACGQLRCPDRSCGRQLCYKEVRLYAGEKTFEKYDQYLTLNTLSQLPSFRWCLGPNCSSGQLYEEDGVEDPRICCGECGFEMCYNHSVPWHEGQTCEEFERTGNHADNERRTEEWIASNTKPCPNCKVDIQKGNYCFHMTCSSCHFQFCWECLVDWRQISRAPGVNNASGHGEGCPFRTNGLNPSLIIGTTLEEALEDVDDLLDWDAHE